MLIPLFEDDSILAIDKPSGLPSHSLTETQTSCESRLKIERPELKLHLVHRLDTGTSGVLVFAKNEQVFNEMREQFKLKRIQKYYRAWSEKTPERIKLLADLKLPFTIDWSLAHHAKSKKRMIALPPGKDRNMRGKPIPAISILHEAHEANFLGLESFCFDLEIITGVMHQIRVHLATIGFPLIGDEVYEKHLRTNPIRLALHAREIRFMLGGYRYQIESPLRSVIIKK